MITTYQPIKAWAEDDQPREKLLFKGKHSLSDAEILAIILGSGSRRKSAVDLAREILDHVDNDLSKLAKKNVKELIKFPGIGQAKAISIIAALELGRRRKEIPEQKIKKVITSRDAYLLLKHHFYDLQHEEFRIILLNTGNKVIGNEIIGKGGVSGTIADGRLIFKSALQSTASGIILAHNHPSGNLSPSKADIDLTKKMIDFGQMVGINVLDHIIITDNGYCSLLEQGFLE